MLTTLLVLVTATFSAQDAGTGVATSPPPPPRADAQAETAPEVRDFMLDSEKLLYDPQAAGLKSVEFDAAVEVPNLGPVGSVHVSWADGANTTVVFAKDPAVQIPPGIPPELLTLSGEEFGRDFLDQMLNRRISPLLQESLAKMEPPQNGMVCISVAREAERAQRIKEHTIFFDEDGVLKVSKLLMDTQGMGVPFSTLPITETYTWKPVGPGSELLVLEMRQGEQDYGALGKEKTTTTFDYTVVDNMALVTGMTIESERPAMMGGRTRHQATLRGLVVNGKPATVTPATAPAAAPADPASPADPNSPTGH